MPAGIYENKCVVVRVPAWHRSGYVAPEPITAREGIRHIGGLPLIGKRRLLWDDGTPSPWFGLGRVGPDGKIAEGFAAVSADYRMITLDEFVDAWEQGTGNALIDTMGVLNGGRIFFITCPMPDTSVLGDEIKRNLSVAHFNDGTTADSCLITGTRWVCQNTLLGSLAREADAVFRVAHDTDIMGNLIGWMQGAYGTALAKAEAVKEAMEIMARRPLTDEEAVETVRITVPLPREPRPTGSANDDVRLRENWGKACDKIVRERATILNLYEGAGLGMKTVAADHTAFGLYNAIGEAYEYVVPSTNPTIQARSYLFGERRTIVQRGFDYLLTLCKN